MKREDLKDLIDRRAEWNLANWARWMHIGQLAEGHATKSSGLMNGGCGSADEFECMCDSADEIAAEISDTVIDGLKSIDHRYPLAIENVYLRRVWTMRGDPGELFIQAVKEFWKVGQAKGLV